MTKPNARKQPPLPTSWGAESVRLDPDAATARACDEQPALQEADVEQLRSLLAAPFSRAALGDCGFRKPYNLGEFTGEEQPDPVNHPPHYTSSPARCECGRQIECIDVTRHLNFCRGNVVKYVWRAGAKGDEVEDMRKAYWYLRDELKRMGVEL